MKARSLLLVTLSLGLSLRLFGLNWDAGYKFHPDERAIIMNVANSNFHWPKTLAEWHLIPTPQSPLNPHWFPYGSLPLYLLKFAGWLGSYIDPSFATYDKINLLGRAMSALFDVGTIFLVYLIAHSLNRSGLFASFLYATAVLPIQLSHFYAVDIILTFFITLTLYFCLRYYELRTTGYVLLIATAAGLAMATKTSALPLAVPIGLTLLISNYKHLKRLIIHSGLLFATCSLLFAICMPYAIIDLPTFSRQVHEQQAMTRDAFTFPYTLQFVGMVKYWYQLKNIFLWGLGPVLASLSFIGIFIGLVDIVKNKNLRLGILASWLIVFFGIVGSFAVGFIRYLAPIYPLLTIFAALALAKIKNSYVLLATCSVLLVWPASFMYIYTQPNPRITATNWMTANIPPGTILAREHWDDGLPLNGPHQLNPELPMYEPDTNPQKWATITTILDSVDYYVIASNRLYAPLIRLGECDKLKLPPNRCYTRTAKFYQDLFAGRSQFTQVAEFHLYPTIPILNIPINDTSADEVFTVYDHPTVFIFKKNP